MRIYHLLLVNVLFSIFFKELSQDFLFLVLTVMLQPEVSLKHFDRRENTSQIHPASLRTESQLEVRIRIIK